MNKFIKLNNNDNYLSFGNVFRVIKEESENNSFIQAELFSVIFDTYDIADSTVNNYCTGLRSINLIYKNYFKNIKEEYQNNSKFLRGIITKIINILENNSEENITIERINENIKLKRVCNKLYNISKNDSDVGIRLSSKLHNYIENNNLYEFMAEVLFYVILDKKQPILVNEQLNEIIEQNIYNTNISANDIQDFVKIQLNSAMWSIRGIKELAKKGNSFACFEMASMEFYGIINGSPRYEEAYNYYKISAEHNHPVANWAIGYLYYNGYIGNKSKRDLYLALKYFNKAKRLNCSNAFNSLGLILLSNEFPHVKRNKKRAMEMFKKSISLGNIYAYNNIGNIYEEEKNFCKAFENYSLSANSGESWAQNKVANYYRQGKNNEKNLKKAFEYYTMSSESSQFTLCLWSKFNLAKYFYEDGNIEIGIKKDINKAIKLLEEVADDLLEASEELIYIYYNLYKMNRKQEYFEKLNKYLEKCEKNKKFNLEIKKKIEKNIKLLKIELPN